MEEDPAIVGFELGTYPMTEKRTPEQIAREIVAGSLTKVGLTYAIENAIRSAVEGLAIPHETSSSGVVTVSIGVAITEASKGAGPQELLRAADQALYRAKDLGRNRVEGAPV